MPSDRVNARYAIALSVSQALGGRMGLAMYLTRYASAKNAMPLTGLKKRLFSVTPTKKTRNTNSACR